MKINKKKSSLALALIALLAIIVGTAWAAGLQDFDYSTGYTTAGGFPFDHTANAPLPASTNLSSDTTAGDWGFLDGAQTNAFNANILSVTGTTAVDQNDSITFAPAPAFTKKGTGKLILSAGNTAGNTATDVSAGTLEVQDNGAIGTGRITVSNGATFIDAVGLSGREVYNYGTVTINAGKNMSPHKTDGTGNANVHGTLIFVQSPPSCSWNISGSATGSLQYTEDLTLSGNNSGFNGKIMAYSNKTLTAKAATALGSGTIDFATATGVTVTYDNFVPVGTVPTKFNAGTDTTNVIDFNTPNALTLTGDSSAFNGTININGGTVTLSGAKIGSSSVKSLAVKVAADKTLKFTNGASVYTGTVTLGADSVLHFDLTGTEPILSADTLAADSTSEIDIVLTAAPASGYLNFTVSAMSTQPKLSISEGFTAAWVGNQIKITANTTPPNISPTSAIFDINNPKDLTFVLSADALAAAKGNTLSITVDGAAVGTSNYTFTDPTLTFSSNFLKTLTIGTHTIQLKNGTANVGTVTLTITATVTPNISPTSATFDINHPKNLTFTLGADALTAAKNNALSITIGGAAVSASNYSFANPILTLSSDFLKTLATGTHTIQLNSGSANVGTVTLRVVDSRYIDSSSSGCNTGALLPIALMLLAPLALLRKKD